MSRHGRDTYFVERDGRIKIGMSNDPVARAKTLGGTLLGFVPGGGPWLEERLHRRFRDLRLEGEWFDDHPNIRDYIATNCRERGADEPLTLGEAAALIGVHPGTLRYWRHIPFTGDEPISRRYLRSDLEAYMAGLDPWVSS